MTNRRISVRVASAIALAATVGLTMPGYGQERTRSINVTPDKTLGSDVGTSLRIERVANGGRTRAQVGNGETVRIGDRVVLCFGAEADGYVSVWSRDAEQNVPVRVFPNEYSVSTANQRGAAVVAGQEVCIGEGDGFGLEIGPPVGDAEVYLHFTRDEALQFDESAFPVVRSGRFRDARPYASSHVRYTVMR